MFYSQTRDYEEEGMIMRNFIFISPHFPTNYENFCVQLHENGVNVFGIGDTPYENLTDSLKTALTEYYKVDSMEDYDQMYRLFYVISMDQWMVLKAIMNTGWSRMPD